MKKKIVFYFTKKKVALSRQNGFFKDIRYFFELSLKQEKDVIFPSYWQAPVYVLLPESGIIPDTLDPKRNELILQFREDLKEYLQKKEVIEMACTTFEIRLSDKFLMNDGITVEKNANERIFISPNLIMPCTQADCEFLFDALPSEFLINIKNSETINPGH